MVEKHPTLGQQGAPTTLWEDPLAADMRPVCITQNSCSQVTYLHHLKENTVRYNGNLLRE